MTRVPVRVHRIPGADPALPLPSYQTTGSAGMDVCANLPEADRQSGISIAPGARILIPTGLAVAIPDGYEIQLRPRSGLALRDGITLLNSPGTIDSDYRGEIGAVLVNHGSQSFQVMHGMRIAQLVLAPVCRIDWHGTDALEGSGRGAGGFGSTGRG